MSKNVVPCGGFELGDSLEIKDGKLDLVNGSGGGLPTGGEPYQYLVTDGTGKATWEDRLAYDESRLVVAVPGDGYDFVKVSSEVPSWATGDVPIKVWLSDGANYTIDPEDYIDLGNGCFMAAEFVVFIQTNNIEFNGIVFPKKGVYFAKFPIEYVTGISSADSDTPEITWDGNLIAVKKIDEKYLPDPLILYVLESGV